MASMLGSAWPARSTAAPPLLAARRNGLGLVWAVRGLQLVGAAILLGCGNVRQLDSRIQVAYRDVQRAKGSPGTLAGLPPHARRETACTHIGRGGEAAGWWATEKGRGDAGKGLSTGLADKAKAQSGKVRTTPNYASLSPATLKPSLKASVKASARGRRTC